VRYKEDQLQQKKVRKEIEIDVHAAIKRVM
jgi:hypothetical protein